MYFLLVGTALAGRPHGELVALDVEGALSTQTVEPIARQLISPSAYCVGEVLTEETELSYQLRVRNGRIVEVSRVREADLKLPEELEACLSRKVGAWPLPGARGETVIDLSYRVTPQGSGPDRDLGTRPVAVLAAQLAEEGRIYHPDRYVRAALGEEDPCANPPNEFVARRCASTRDAMVEAADGQVGTGFVLARVRAEFGSFDFDQGSFPVRIEPHLVTGGIGTPNAPALTVGQLRPQYASSSSSDHELVGGFPLTMSTVRMSDEAAEALVQRTDRELYGIALVRISETYEHQLRTGLWEDRASSPSNWSRRQKRGEVRDEDTTVTWYAMEVEPIAVELYDPMTGAAISGWLAEGYDLSAEEGVVRLVEPNPREG